MQKAQQIVGIGAFSGVVGMILLVWLFSAILPTPGGMYTVTDQIIYTLRLIPVALFPLLVMIITIGNERFLSDAINPLAHKENQKMEINARVTDNTLQQTVLFVPALLALSTVLTPERMSIVGALVIVFVIARTLFWIGYHINPLYRAPGMAGTGYMNVGIMLAVLYMSFF